MKISHVVFVIFFHVLLKYVIQCNYKVLIKAILRAVQHSIMQKPDSLLHQFPIPAHLSYFNFLLSKKALQ